MHVIRALNVNDAWPQALRLLEEEGERRPSRNGSVVVVPEPVSTVYEKPTERALFDPVRDANPIFHLHEALWMLAGRDDATWLDRFVRDFSARFAEDEGRMHGAYGRRWRSWFERAHHEAAGNYGNPGTIDQLDTVVRLLRADPYDRQAVIQMWDAEADLGVPGLADRPCNTQIYLRADRGSLDATVTCRSNDAVYGAYGANVVHFSVLQEYLAARIGIPVGRYTQVSNNFHMYDWSLKQVDVESAEEWMRDGDYPAVRPLVDDPETFDEEVRAYVEDPLSVRVLASQNTFLAEVAQPMFRVNELRLEGDLERALASCSHIEAGDWRVATERWIARRLARREVGS